jgi:hypothetical protein
LGSCHEWKQTPTEELVEPILHGKYLTDLNPNRKAATKGGSMPAIFRPAQSSKDGQKNDNSPCS